MGGVYNTVNLHVYHYAGNNPVKYVAPDGRKPAPITSAYKMNSYTIDLYGGTKEPINLYGCALILITNLAVTLGHNKNPLSMNNSDFLDKGNVIWQKVAAGLNLTLETERSEKLSPSAYSNYFYERDKEQYIFAKVKYNSKNDPHWVGINGMMHDDSGKGYYEISPTSTSDIPAIDSDREEQGWKVIGGRIFVPVDKVTAYKVYSRLIEK
jgi:hypothetical protein